jgi:hypothetical protein
MLRYLAAGVAAIVMVVTARPAKAGEPGATISVRVDNVIGIPIDWLHAAQKEASEAYETIGISLIWLNNGEVETASGDHEFSVLLGRSIRMKRAPRGALGFAPHHTNRIYVFGDRIAALAVGRRDFEVILGRVLAHELGHHLLPGQGHSNEGLMQKQVDFRSAKEVGFTVEQRKSIQERFASN